MVRIDVEYTGELRCRSVHEPSGAALVTDAPRDNHGKGEAFSPTDTLATALATCMLTVMGIRAQKEGWPDVPMRARVEKHMTSEPPRRVAKLVVSVTVEEPASGLHPDQKQALVLAGETCPVRLSLSPAIAVETSYEFREVAGEPAS